MNDTLAGRTIVVTRPQRQAGAFIELATRAGASCIALPALEIETLVLDAADRARLAPDAYDWAVYTSTNAVDASLAQLAPPQRCRVAAVGRATARALEAHGIVVQARPAGRSDSEGLLAVPALAQLAGQRVLILRGAGGRELLREQLQARGATVTVGELYRRRVAPPDPAALAALASALQDHAEAVVVAVTSVEVLDGLLQVVPPELADRLRSSVLLLPGDRVAGAARERRWAGPIVVAGSAEDDSMLSALTAYAAAGAARPA